jgi:hypothetical protein
MGAVNPGGCGCCHVETGRCLNQRTNLDGMKVLHDEFAEEIPISESRALSITFEAHNIEFNSGDIFEKLTKDLQRVQKGRVLPYSNNPPRVDFSDPSR